MPEESASFPCFGGIATVLVGGDGADGRSAHDAVAQAKQLLEEIHRRLTRFERDSELCRLNADPREQVEASPVMLALARAVREAGLISDGLVDATLLTELEAAGYAASRASAGGLREVLPAPPTGPAAPSALERWRDVGVIEGSVVRPPGTRIDSGGLAKGLAADLAATLLADHPTVCVICDGDLRVAGDSGAPRRISVMDPAGERRLEEFDLSAGGVATSGVHRRSWRGSDGSVSHHLIDPRSGRPAFTGIVQATALACTAFEADVRAKAALLAGPDHAERYLPYGGVLLLHDGAVRSLPARDTALGESATVA